MNYWEKWNFCSWIYIRLLCLIHLHITHTHTKQKQNAGKNNGLLIKMVCVCFFKNEFMNCCYDGMNRWDMMDAHMHAKMDFGATCGFLRLAMIWNSMELFHSRPISGSQILRFFCENSTTTNVTNIAQRYFVYLCVRATMTRLKLITI